MCLCSQELFSLWPQAPKLLGLFMVVCFGSCMDVAAIQSDMPFPLDFNRELMTVGEPSPIHAWQAEGRGASLPLPPP